MIKKIVITEYFKKRTEVEIEVPDDMEEEFENNLEALYDDASRGNIESSEEIINSISSKYKINEACDCGISPSDIEID